MIIASFARGLEQLRQQPHYYDAITIGQEAPGASLCRRQLVLDFNNLRALPDLSTGNRPDKSAPQMKHVCKAVAFARKTADERLLIHCPTGLARGPAIAWCILLDRLGGTNPANEALFKLQAQAIPNQAIIYCGLEILTGSPREFATVMTEMRRLSCHPQKMLFL